MSLRLAIVEMDTKEVNVRQFCVQHGITTWTFYELRRRFSAGGLEAIQPRSRAPHRVANRTPIEVEDAIVEIRKELEEQGLDAGAATIAGHLEDRGLAVPSEATIWRLLHARGCITPDPSKAPKRAMRRFAAERANECWQFDDTWRFLADGTEVKVIDIIDDCTRVLVGSVAVPHCTSAAIFEAITGATAEWGWPERLLCDNALAHYALHDTFGALGIATRHGRPFHPQTTGKVERVHRTIKQYLEAHDTPQTLTELQHQLDSFRHIYNNQRRHRAIGRRIPADVWNATPKSGPANRPLDTPTTVHRVTVGENGVVPVTRRWRISLGRTHAAKTATIITTGHACHVFIDSRLIRELTLDPTRRLQPITTTVRHASRHP
jgi:transposase InsO family protein